MITMQELMPSTRQSAELRAEHFIELQIGLYRLADEIDGRLEELDAFGDHPPEDASETRKRLITARNECSDLLRKSPCVNLQHAETLMTMPPESRVRELLAWQQSGGTI